jgi:hypothetical protein
VDDTQGCVCLGRLAGSAASQPRATCTGWAAPARGTTNGPKRSAEMERIAATLAEVGELLAVLSVKLESATGAEIPALINDTREATRGILRSCLASDSIESLPPEEAELLRVELAKLGEALQAQIAGIIEARWAQLTGGSVAPTLH